MPEEPHLRVPLTVVLRFVNLLKMVLHCLNLKALLSNEVERFFMRPSVISVYVCESPHSVLPRFYFLMFHFSVIYEIFM